MSLVSLVSLATLCGCGGGGTVGLLRGLGTGRGRGREPDWNGKEALGLVFSGGTTKGGGVLGGLGVLGGNGSSPGSMTAVVWKVGGVTWLGGSGGGWLGAWRGGWLLEWRRGIVLDWITNWVGLGERLLGEWVERGLGDGERDWGVPHEGCGADWLPGWPEVGLAGLGGAGAGFFITMASRLTVSNQNWSNWSFSMH